MPTNEQRRATAKRKLERQLERRAAQERKRRILAISGSAVAALVIIGAVVATFVFTSKDSGSTTASATSPGGLGFADDVVDGQEISREPLAADEVQLQLDAGLKL